MRMIEREREKELIMNGWGVQGVARHRSLVENTGKVIIEHHAADASRELSLDCVETQRAVP